MLLHAFQAFVILSAMIALVNWRAGLYLLIVVAAIEDPIRKLTPGSPGYLALSTVPVWVGIVVGAWTTEPYVLASFRRAFRDLSSAIGIFLFFLAIASVKSATYGAGSWQLTLVGLFGYLSGLAGLVMGYGLARKEGDLDKLLGFYCIVTAIVLVGAPLEYLGIASGWSALGTAAMGTRWVRYRMGYTIEMTAGFYRSPDILGWHSTALSMLSICLALRNKGARRYMWVGLAGWGIIGGMLCGRRKMVLMLPVFGIVLFWLYRHWTGRGRARSPVGVLVTSVILGYAMYHQVGANPDVESYYFLDTGDVFERISAHGYDALLVTYRQSGFWGEGVGTATQGTHHLRVERPRTWQEGGLARLLVELGVPGFIAALFLAYTLVKTVFQLITSLELRSQEFYLIAGLASVFFANAASFIVSHQIFGDPFINCFFALTIGMALSGERYGPPVVGRSAAPIAKGPEAVPYPL